jgi:hypothetical protein
MLTAETSALRAAHAAGADLSRLYRRAEDSGDRRPGARLHYVAALQQADNALAAALVAAGPDAPAPARAALEGRRALADAAIARETLEAARLLGAHRQDALDTLNGLFALGRTPGALAGEYRGRLLSATVAAPIDAVGRVATRLYMPWLGKRFQPEASGGDNVFVGSAPILGHMLWPTFGGYHALRPGRLTAFPFRTYTGPGVRDPDLTVLKLDYDNPANPGFIVRRVLDELVQLSGRYYLGKVYLRHGADAYLLTGFFTLRS